MKKTIITGIIALSLATTSCDSYLDINQSPTSPAVDNLTPSMIFPAAEMAFANSYGDYYHPHTPEHGDSAHNGDKQ